MTADRLWSRGPEDGIELLAARLHGLAYRQHRHDTYAICVTTAGVQTFTYRGTREVSLPGQVVVLHPDELHDGHAGTDAGFGYRQLYLDPARIFDAVQVLRGGPAALPFVPTPVMQQAKLARAVAEAFAEGDDTLARDGVVLQVAEGLLEAAGQAVPIPSRLDLVALDRAHQFLATETTRVVRSAELEAVTGLTRYELARQFRRRYGTSPYRYLLMRRLDAAREQLAGHRSLTAVAFDAGFADQAHFTRMFTAAFGLTPARYRAALGRPGAPRDVAGNPRCRVPADNSGCRRLPSH